jgi:hypothetical protein
VQTVRHYAVRHLERLPLGTPYTAICTRLRGMFDKPPRQNGTLIVDQTGVGRPVVELLKRSHLKACIRHVTINVGQSATQADGGGWNVPKKELVSTLQVLLQGRRLKVAQTLPEAETLVKELQNFKAKINLSSATEAFEDWRERDDDDLVLAVAIAAWQGERSRDCEVAFISNSAMGQGALTGFGGWLRPMPR